jgi:hypothetical protein
MSTRRDGWATQADANAAQLQGALHALASQHKDALGSVSYRDFWRQSREIHELFKTLRPLRSEVREALWAEFAGLRAEVAEQERREREARSAISRRRRDLVLATIEEAEAATRVAEDRESLRRADDLLQRAIEMMKGGWGHLDWWSEGMMVLSSDDGTMLHDDHQECWRHWEQARDHLRGRRDTVAYWHYRQAEALAGDALSSACGPDPHAALRLVKEAQQAVRTLYLQRGQVDVIRGALDRAWQQAVSRIEERREEARRKHEEWRQRQEDHVARWEATIDRNQDIVADLDRQIADCEGMLAGARGADFAAQVEGWIAEKVAKRRDICATSRELEARIRDVQHRLRG